MAENTDFSVAVHDLMHKPGQMRELKLDIITPDQMGEGIALIPQGAELDLDVRLE